MSPCIRNVLLAQSLELSQGLRTQTKPAGAGWLVPAVVRRGPNILVQSGLSFQHEEHCANSLLVTGNDLGDGKQLSLYSDSS